MACTVVLGFGGGGAAVILHARTATPCSGAARDVPVFFVETADGSQACAFDYAGQPVGRHLIFPHCFESCYEVIPSPDGRLALTGGMVTDTATGRQESTVPEIQADAWAVDGMHVCNSSFGPSPVTIDVTRVFGVGTVSVMTDAFNTLHYSAGQIVDCDPARDRAVLEAEFHAVAGIAIVRLSDGTTLAQHDFLDLVTGVTRSPDGRYIAVQQANQSPPRPGGTPGPCIPGGPCEIPPPEPPPPVATYFDVFDAENPATAVLERVPGQINGFSGDSGALLVTQFRGPGQDGPIQALRWTDLHVLWSAQGSVNRVVGAPGYPSMAVQIFSSADRSTRILTVADDGTATPVTDEGQLLS